LFAAAAAVEAAAAVAAVSDEEAGRESAAGKEFIKCFGAKFVCIALITASSSLRTDIRHQTTHRTLHTTSSKSYVTGIIMITHASDQNRAPEDCVKLCSTEHALPLQASPPTVTTSMV
jgi:hypothetical protein